MTHFDDELAAALAEIAADTPPSDLKVAALQRALERRPAGRPVDGASPCTPAEAFSRTIADLISLLSSLDGDQWNLAAHPDHGRIRDLIAHLIGVEALSARWLDPEDDVPPVHDHVESTRDVVTELADCSPTELAARWHQAALAVLAAATTGDPDRSVTFHDLSSPVDGFLVTRTFELWAHSIDIAAAAGRAVPMLDAERMALLSSRLMAAVPRALAYRRAALPGHTARFVLTGASGGCYTVALDPRSEPTDPDVLIVADAIDLCRVAARRLRADDLPMTIEGDAGIAAHVLAGLDAFARD